MEFFKEFIYPILSPIAVTIITYFLLRFFDSSSLSMKDTISERDNLFKKVVVQITEYSNVLSNPMKLTDYYKVEEGVKGTLRPVIASREFRNLASEVDGLIFAITKLGPRKQRNFDLQKLRNLKGNLIYLSNTTIVGDPENYYYGIDKNKTEILRIVGTI